MSDHTQTATGSNPYVVENNSYVRDMSTSYQAFERLLKKVGVSSKEQRAIGIAGQTFDGRAEIGVYAEVTNLDAGDQLCNKLSQRESNGIAVGGGRTHKGSKSYIAVVVHADSSTEAATKLSGFLNSANRRIRQQSTRQPG